MTTAFDRGEEGVSSTDSPDTAIGRMATRELLVVGVRLEAEGVISVDLEAPPGSPALEKWEPGAHLELRLPGGIVRQYSLFGDPHDTSRYRIAVLREPESRGGSAHLHDTPLVGRTLDVRGPRNKFPLLPGSDYVFVAGGIGITPITAMAREASRRGANWQLHYGGRSRRNMALIDEVSRLAADDSQVHIIPQDETGLIDLETIVSHAPDRSLIYACGPEPMLRALEAQVEASVPPRELHLERFAAAAPADRASGPATEPGAADNGSFELELRRTGITVTVPADRTVLEVVRDHVPDAPASCEEGFCGSCECRVLEGVPDHRDDVLTPDEKEENETMMLCVSRSRSERLVIDL